MHIKQIFAGVAVAFVAMACTGENSEVKTDTAAVAPVETEKEVKTFDDSVAYFMGQDAALAYWSMAKSDTIMAGQKNAEEFSKGVEDGLKAAAEAAAYAVGFQHGLMTYSNISGLNQSIKTNLSREAFLKGFKMAMESEKMVDPIKFQADMSEIQTRLNTMLMQVGNDSIQ